MSIDDRLVNPFMQEIMGTLEKVAPELHARIERHAATAPAPPQLGPPRPPIYAQRPQHRPGPRVVVSRDISRPEVARHQLNGVFPETPDVAERDK